MGPREEGRTQASVGFGGAAASKSQGKPPAYCYTYNGRNAPDNAVTASDGGATTCFAAA